MYVDSVLRHYVGSLLAITTRLGWDITDKIITRIRKQRVENLARGLLGCDTVQ